MGALEALGVGVVPPGAASAGAALDGEEPEAAGLAATGALSQLVGITLFLCRARLAAVA